jgi:hypothetical protein
MSVLEINRVVADNIAFVDDLTRSGTVSRACIIGKEGGIRAMSLGYEVSLQSFVVQSVQKRADQSVKPGGAGCNHKVDISKNGFNRR